MFTVTGFSIPVCPANVADVFFYVALAWCITCGDIEYARSVRGIGKNAVKSSVDNILSGPSKRTGYLERRAVCGRQERVSTKELVVSFHNRQLSCFIVRQGEPWQTLTRVGQLNGVSFWL